MVYMLIAVGDVVNITQIAFFFFFFQKAAGDCKKHEVINELTFK